MAPLAAVAAAPAAPFDDVAGASCRDANFLNALNIAMNFFCLSLRSFSSFSLPK